MPGLAYDEQGALATYFVLTFLSLVLVPSTFLSLKPKTKVAPRKSTQLPQATKLKRDEARERVFGKVSPKNSSKPTKKTLFIIFGWFVFAGLAYRISLMPSVQQVLYNPFEVLGISENLSDKEIKRAYKKLSLKFHPDKIKLAENETREDADAKFVEITKAYKALTDEVVRENWLSHGNPDGVQQREEMIAIPKWVVEGSNSGWVLGLYGLLFGGLMPYLVGSWWFVKRKFTRDGALNSTASFFFLQVREESSFAELIDILGSASDFVPLVGGPANGQKASDKKGSKKELKSTVAEVESLVKKVAAEKGVEGVMEHKFDSTYSRLTAALIWSHLLRIQDLCPTHIAQRTAILTALPPVLKSLLEISLAQNWLTTSTKIMKIQSYLSQATMPELPALLQLPYISYEDASKLENESLGRDEGWISAWNTASTSEKQALVADLSSDEIAECDAVAQDWPKLEIVDAKFQVVGEKIITPASIVQCLFKLKLTTSSGQLSNGNGPTKEELIALIREEDDMDSEEAAEKFEAEKKLREERDKKAREEALAYAPFWPSERPLRYWFLIGDIKADRVIVQPGRIVGLLPNGPTEEFSLQFQAPAGAGLYTFQAYFISDSIVGEGDARVGMQLKVEMPVEEAVDDEDEISDPEEDSLAGQMAALRGESVKKSQALADDSSDEDSSSDEEDAARRKRSAQSSDSDSDSD